MRCFLGLLTFLSFNFVFTQASAAGGSGNDRLKAFEKHQREAIEFNEDREEAVDGFLKIRKKFEIEREQTRENFLKNHKELPADIEEESKPGFKDFAAIKKKQDKEFLQAQAAFLKEKSELKNKMVNSEAVEVVEYGLQDTEKNRIDPTQRKIYGHTAGLGGSKFSRGGSSGSGSSGGSSGAGIPSYSDIGGGSNFPPPMPREEVDEFDEIEAPPPPPPPMEGFNEGMPPPPPPPPPSDFNF